MKFIDLFEANYGHMSTSPVKTDWEDEYQSIVSHYELAIEDDPTAQEMLHRIFKLGTTTGEIWDFIANKFPQAENPDLYREFDGEKPISAVVLRLRDNPQGKL